MAEVHTLGENCPLISIIVPVYNVEAYLERCLRSLSTQKYQNIEVLLVDDCSTDNSLEICKTFESEDKRFRYMRLPKNSGAGMARQYGIERAHGEIIGFADGDDWVEPDFISSLYEVMEATGCDIVCCQYFFCYEDGRMNTPWPVDNERKVISKSEAIFRMCRYDGIGTELWNKLYKKEVFHGNVMETRDYEDAFVLIKYFLSSKKVCIFKMPLYYYFQREGSLMNTCYTPEKELAHLKLCFEQVEALARLGFQDTRFYNGCIRRGIRCFKDFTLLGKSDCPCELLTEALEYLGKMKQVLDTSISRKNRIESWLIIKATCLYKTIYSFCVLKFGKRRLEILKHKFEKSSAQFLKDGE